MGMKTRARSGIPMNRTSEDRKRGQKYLEKATTIRTIWKHCHHILGLLGLAVVRGDSWQPCLQRDLVLRRQARRGHRGRRYREHVLVLAAVVGQVQVRPRGPRGEPRPRRDLGQVAHGLGRSGEVAGEAVAAVASFWFLQEDGVEPCVHVGLCSGWHPEPLRPAVMAEHVQQKRSSLYYPVQLKRSLVACQLSENSI